VLISHPLIADAAVVASPDEEAGDVPKTFLVLKDATDPERVAKEVMAYLAERVAPYKRVRRYELVDAIPRTPSGKILRRGLIERQARHAMQVDRQRLSNALPQQMRRLLPALKQQRARAQGQPISADLYQAFLGEADPVGEQAQFLVVEHGVSTEFIPAAVGNVGLSGPGLFGGASTQEVSSHKRLARRAHDRHEHIAILAVRDISRGILAEWVADLTSERPVFPYRSLQVPTSGFDDMPMTPPTQCTFHTAAPSTPHHSGGDPRNAERPA